jgi:hypothetical protein
MSQDEQGGSLRVLPQGPVASSELFGWRTSLGSFDASGYDTLIVPLRAPGPARITVADTCRGQDAFAYQPALPLSEVAKAGIDLSRLAYVGLEFRAATGGPIEAGGIAFARGTQTMPGGTPSPIRRVTMAIDGTDGPAIPAAGRVTRLQLTAAPDSSPITNARLVCAGQELRLPFTIPAGATAWVSPGAKGGLRIAVPSRSKRFDDFAAYGARLAGLRWEREFRVLMLERPKEAGRIAFDVGVPYPVTAARFMLEGRKGKKTTWGVTVRVGDKEYEAESVDTFGWVERERFRLPEGFPPSQWFTVEFHIAIDSDEPNWEWDGSLGGVSMELEQDCSGAPSIVTTADEPGVLTDREPSKAHRLVTVELAEP